jgi:tetratricopeptide (TPR) repeat protein
MSRNSQKYIFFISSALLLVIMIYLSRYAGISCDEVLHYRQSEAVYKFFTSGGTDRSALNTPDTHLQYYGQSFDNLTTFLIHWFRIEDIFRFRHIISALAGWAVIFLTALFAVWLSGYRTGIAVLFLFVISPTFMGHAMNNLKDIPFALGYIASLFFSLKFLFPEKKSSFSVTLFLIISIAVALSIRAGGLILICYLVFFFLIKLLHDSITGKRSGKGGNWKILIILVLVSFAAFFLSILLWPFALQDPFRNVYESYRIMAHFPSTFRQIFEGKVMWSDFMPWYFIPKSMAITIPVIVLSGIALFMGFTKKIFTTGKVLLYGLVVFTILFPLFFVIVEKSNLYSSWRQFLFLYPPIIIISAEGLIQLFELLRSRLLKWSFILILLLLAVHPIEFMFQNFMYSYLYYNQLEGGLKGAYGNYETDYYYIGQTEASGWLIKYLAENKNDTALVSATFSVNWQFRDLHGIRTSYFRNEERSMSDWDYAIINNRYITPFMLKNNKWPPGGTIHTIFADRVPICVVLERKTKADYYGYKALEEGRNSDAINFFREALKIVNDDEMIFYNFARALFNEGNIAEADSVLNKALEVNPEFEPALMYLGNIARSHGDGDKAIMFYDRVISINRKYFAAYVEKAKILGETDKQEARKLLRSCLMINPRFKPAIIALADSYRESDPDIAEKYDRLAENIE